MQYLEFEFETEKEMKDAVKKLWEKLGVTGEMATRQVKGRWRLEVSSEKDLRDSTLEQFASNRVETGD